MLRIDHLIYLVCLLFQRTPEFLGNASLCSALWIEIQYEVSSGGQCFDLLNLFIPVSCPLAKSCNQFFGNTNFYSSSVFSQSNSRILICEADRISMLLRRVADKVKDSKSTLIAIERQSCW